MTTLNVIYNQTTRIVRVSIDEENEDIPEGYVPIGSFSHPDPVYPGSLVIYHGIRDLLYKRSHANPTNEATYPFNIVDMNGIKIETTFSSNSIVIENGTLLVDGAPLLIDGSVILIT